uniref:Fascin-2 n=1 Tax=Schistocephalus solidus TaxID=70667 RepID=A0A0X3PMM8_SCHSO
MMKNGNSHRVMIEFCKLGLMHVPSGRLLTSETFQGALNVSGTSLKRRQIWTIYVDAANPTAFFLQNHMGHYLSASHDGKVSVLAEEPGEEERFFIDTDVSGSGLVTVKSAKYLLYLQWTDNGMRCFSKEPVWWGTRWAIHPQVHLLSVHRNNYIRSANKDSELRAVQKAPKSKKFLFWLEQMPLSKMTPRPGADSLTKGEVGCFSRVAIRSQSGRYLCSNGSMADEIRKGAFFSIIFKPSKTPCVLLKDEFGDYLTVLSNGRLMIRPRSTDPRREDFFALKTPSIQVRMWAFNKKFACVKHGLSFNATDDEIQMEKNSIFQLEYVGGKGLDIPKLLACAESSPLTFSCEESDYAPQDTLLPTGLWRLRGPENKVWQFPRTGPAEMALENVQGTTFEILFLTSYEETSTIGHSKVNARGGILLRSVDGLVVSAKALGPISTAENHRITADYRPTESEIFHLIPFMNRPSVALYSALAYGFLGPTTSRRGDKLSLECGTTIVGEWFVRRLPSGTCQLMFRDSGSWLVLSAQGNGALVLVPTPSGPRENEEEEEEEARKVTPSYNTEFVFCLLSEKHVLLRSVLHIGGKPGFLCAGVQGDVKLDTSGNITAGCIWQI